MTHANNQPRFFDLTNHLLMQQRSDWQDWMNYLKADNDNRGRDV